MPDIPMDILQEVFKQSLSSPLQAHKAYEFPWYLGHVCSRWRAMFFSMRSTFWNRIEIEWRDSYDGIEDFTFIAEIVPFFLGCTRGAPFSFAFSIDNGYSDDSDAFYDIRPTLVDFLNRSEQWEEVSIQLLSTELVFLGCAVKGRLLLLKKLEIIVAKDGEYEYTRTTIPSVVTDVFRDAPLLKQVVLWGISTWEFKFNWSSLTVVTFQQQDRKKIFAVLRETINLVDLAIENTDYAFTTQDLNIERSELIHLPHLERLSVDNVGLLAALETPSLQRLKIVLHLSEPNYINEAGITATFLRRSGAKLSSLAIESGRAAIIKEILSLTPELDSLALLNVRNIANVFTWMAETEMQEVRFNSLYVSWSCLMGGLEALYDMIDCRNPPDNERNSSPKEVFIYIPEEDQSVGASLKSLCRDRGIRFGFMEEVTMLPWGVDLK